MKLFSATMLTVHSSQVLTDDVNCNYVCSTAEITKAVAGGHLMVGLEVDIPREISDPERGA